MQSMTGYGRGDVSRDGRELVLELKSVNHRFLDPSFRMPKELAFAEDLLRRSLNDSPLHRGHVEVSIQYRNHREDAYTFTVDEGKLAAFRGAVMSNAALLEGFTALSAAEALSLSQSFSVTPAAEDTAAIEELLKEALSVALAAMMEMRLREGTHLAEDLLSNLSEFCALREKIALRAPSVPLDYRKRLLSRLEELAADPVEPQRVAQEVALMTDKCAIDEELSRLESHIAQFRQIVAGTADAGRKLDFLLQEMNREINTIGSKASDAEIAQAVVDAKCVLEKLREQVQNVV